jgi:TrmH family RNA methyltransferase
VSGVKVYAAVARTSYPPLGSGAPTAVLRPWDVDWKKPAAILIGNEGAGLPEELVDAADARVYIPQTAPAGRVGIESLNAAMAASVLLYEVMRQRAAVEVH